MHGGLKPALVSSAVSIVASVALTLYLIRPTNTPAPKHSDPNDFQYDQSIIDEQQARTRAFLKEEGMSKVRQSCVVIVGAGGVGSWVANMLVRNGIGHIKIIDFDQVSLSSLNRHSVATLADVGTSKVECIARRLKEIAPWTRIEPINSVWNKDIGPPLLTGADYVVDCIDNIDTKVDLLAYCVENNLPVISSMGAGAKGDPTRVTVGDISTTYEDPLSRSVRIKLRFRGINQGIPVVYSTEKPSKDKAKLLSVPQNEIEKGQVNELSVLRDFRVGILPVLGPLPAIFGLTIATHLLNLIGGYNTVFDPVLGGYSLAGKKRTPLYESMLHSFHGQIARLKRTDTYVIDLNDVKYLIEEVWRGKSISGQSNRLRLTIWDPNSRVDIHNMVPVNRDEQLKHEELILRGGKSLTELYDEETLNVVRARMDLDKWYQHFRVN